jgi:hypothetical protein
MPLAAVAGIGAAGSLISGIIGSNAAGNAASTQAAAANNAAQLQSQTAANSLAFQQQQYNTSQQEAQPWLQSGTGAVSQLDYLLGITPQGTGQNSGQMSGMSMPSSTGQVSAPGQITGTAQSSRAPGGLTLTGNPQSPSALSGVSIPGKTTTSGIQGLTATPQATPFQATPGPAGSGGFGSLMTPYSGSFTAPTGLTEQNDPGYQARLQLGTQALQQSAAARGNVVTGGTANDLNQYAQNFATNDYQNVYNNALNTYNTNYNQYQQQQAKQYNQLAALSGAGQQTAQTLGTQGQAAANTAASTAAGAAGQIGQDYQNAGSANASGYVGGANAINGAINSGTSNLSQLMMLQQLQNKNSNPTVQV